MKVAWPDLYSRASYEGDYVRSSTNISANQEAYHFVTREKKMKMEVPSSMDTTEPGQEITRQALIASEGHVENAPQYHYIATSSRTSLNSNYKAIVKSPVAMLLLDSVFVLSEAPRDTPNCKQYFSIHILPGVQSSSILYNTPRTNRNIDSPHFQRNLQSC